MAELSREVQLRDFVYHSVEKSTARKMTLLRAKFYWMAEYLLDTLPDTRERALALTALQESSMRAIQCLAVTEGTPIPNGFMSPGNTADPTKVT
jgi:hypothetical protein